MSLQIMDRLLWPGGRRKAFTLSYDDGIEQDRRLLRMLNRLGVKATFNLNSGLMGQTGRVSAGKKEVDHNKIAAEDISSVYRGHEIAAHGLYHSSIYGMDPARCCYEILTCRQELEAMLGHPVTGYAYAFGSFDDTVLQAIRACGITYARTIRSTHSFDIPQDFLTWDPTCHHDDEALGSLTEQFLDDGPYFSLYSPAKLFYVWGHSYEFDQNDNWEHIEHFLEKVSGRDDIWYAANGEICSYVSAYRRLIFSADSSTVFNPTSYSIWLGGIMAPGAIEVKPGCVTKLPAPAQL